MPDAIDSFVESILKSEEAKTFYKSHPSMVEYKRRLKAMPIFYYEMTDPILEKNHFSVIYRHLAKREYPGQPYLHDLYTLHELYHMAHYSIDPDSSFTDWKQKVSENELYASLFTEVLIYLMVPKIRENAFKNKAIWADRWMDNHISTINLFEVNQWPDVARDVLQERLRLRAYAGSVSALSEPEKHIVGYNAVRDRWLENWEPHYTAIDTMLLELKQTQEVSAFNKKLAQHRDPHTGLAFFTHFPKIKI